MSKRSLRDAWVIVAVLLGIVLGAGVPGCNPVLGVDKIDTSGCPKPGERQCSGNNTPQTCGPDGQWKDVPEGPCVNQTCIEGAGVGSCAPGKRCKGNTPQTCDDANGQWTDNPLCGASEHCQGGVCVVACTPGDSQCSGAQPQSCDGSGTWQKNGAICDQCYGCDPDTAACSGSPKSDGMPCADNDLCTQTDTCQSGVCMGANPKVCSALDQCHVPGTCTPATGCSNPVKVDGNACDDGTACTQTDLCQAGTCTGGNPVVTSAFAATASYPTGSYPVSVAALDLNGDGKPDLAVANSHSDTVSVLLGGCFP